MLQLSSTTKVCLLDNHEINALHHVFCLPFLIGCPTAPLYTRSVAVSFSPYQTVSRTASGPSCPGGRTARYGPATPPCHSHRTHRPNNPAEPTVKDVHCNEWNSKTSEKKFLENLKRAIH